MELDYVADLVLHYPYIQMALLGALLASIACGIVGTLVIYNRLTFLAGGASHAAYGGIGVALYFQLPIIACTLVFSSLAALLMALVTLRQEKEGGTAEPDSAIGVLWAAGMAFGIILMQLTPGYNAELTGFLFGSILAVSHTDIQIMLLFDICLIIIVTLFRQGLWAISLDRDFAKVRGISANFLYMLLVVLTAIAVVMVIRIVGLILVLALLTIPPYIAQRFHKGIFLSMFFSFLLAVFFCMIGLYVSVVTDLIPGPCIVAIATIAYGLCLLPIPLKRDKTKS